MRPPGARALRQLERNDNDDTNGGTVRSLKMSIKIRSYCRVFVAANCSASAHTASITRLGICARRSIASCSTTSSSSTSVKDGLQPRLCSMLTVLPSPTPSSNALRTEGRKGARSLMIAWAGVYASPSEYRASCVASCMRPRYSKSSRCGFTSLL